MTVSKKSAATIALLVAAILICAHELLLLPDGKLHVYFLDVGQGDCALIVTPSGKQIVIDGGRDNSALWQLGKHMPFFDRSIDMLVLTHPQLDHMFAFPEILRRYRVGRIVMTGIDYNLPRYDEFLSLIREQRIPIWIADPAIDIDFGDGVVFDVVWPAPTLLGQSRKDINDTSIVLRLLHENGSVLFTGDIEEKGEMALLATGANIDADVLKVGHHGSKTSSSVDFLKAITPTLAVASVSKDNSYGHPHAEIVDRFKTLGIPLRMTSQEGTVDIEF